jgi:hypothetical protein
MLNEHDLQRAITAYLTMRGRDDYATTEDDAEAIATLVGEMEAASALDSIVYQDEPYPDGDTPEGSMRYIAADAIITYVHDRVKPYLLEFLRGNDNPTHYPLFGGYRRYRAGDGRPLYEAYLRSRG